jgi:thioesterase domain-containing protein
MRERQGRSAPADDLGELERLEMIRLQAYRAAMRQYDVLDYDGEAVLVRPGSTRSKHLVDPTYGWGDRVRSLNIVDVPGDHLNHLKRPNVEVLADSLRGYLDRGRNGHIGKETL